MSIVFPSLKNIIIVVSGFPRTGTSLMMKMLYLGGIEPIAHPEEMSDIDPDSVNDGSNLYNPHGYFELKNVGLTLQEKDLSWMRGRALKLVAPYIRHLPVDYNLKFKVIFMLRDINEIIASMMAMKSVYEWIPGDAIDYARSFLKHWDIPTHFVQFKDVMKYPKTEAVRVADFLEADLNTDAMATALDRNVRELLDADNTKKKRTIIKMIDGKTEPVYVSQDPSLDDLKVNKPTVGGP